jgi:hypothetical protein
MRANAAPSYRRAATECSCSTAAGHYDDEIAQMLTAEGTSFATAKHRGPAQHGPRYPHSKWNEDRATADSLACHPGLLDSDATRQRLRIPQKWIHAELRRGALRTIVEPSGRYLFPDTEPAMQAVRELREHRIRRVDLGRVSMRTRGITKGDRADIPSRTGVIVTDLSTPSRGTVDGQTVNRLRPWPGIAMTLSMRRQRELEDGTHVAMVGGPDAAAVSLDD